MNAAAIGFVSGGVSTGSLKGAISGAISGAAFSQIGSYLGEHFAGNFAADLSQTGFGLKVAAHALTGGVMSVLQGGKFGHGFASAGVTAGFTSVNNSEFWGGAGFSVQRVVAAAVIGGTTSKLTGGKFGNGALTGAFSQALNNESQEIKKAAQFYDKDDPYYHYYEMENEICSLSTEGCSASAVWGELKKNPAPGWDNSKQVTTGDETSIVFSGIKGGTVSHIVDDANMTLYNVTHSDHIFSDGYVSRSVVVRGGSVFVRSVGEGITSPGSFNVGNIVYLTRFSRMQLNLLTYKPGFNSLDGNIRKAFQ